VRSEILVRRILGASFLGLLVISALGGLGIAPFLWIASPLIVSAVYSGPLSADNISAISTSRDGPPFNGAVFRNTTFQVNITFTDVISVTTHPRVNITLRVWDSPDKNVLRVNVTNVTAWPINPSATAVRLYNTTVLINASGIFIGNLTGTSTDLRTFIPVIRFTAAFNLEEGNLLELGNFSSTGVFVPFVSLVYRHTPVTKDTVTGIPSTVPSANLSSINLTGTFGFTAPDLNMLWNVRDNTTIFLNIQNTTFRLIPNGNATLNLTETERNTGIFQNTSVMTLGHLFPDNATTFVLPEGSSYNLTLYIPKYNITGTPRDTDPGFDAINVTFTVGPPPPEPPPPPPVRLDLLVDRDFIPATVDYDISINVTIIDSTITSTANITFGSNLNATLHNHLGLRVKTEIPLSTLFMNTSVVNISANTFYLWITIRGSPAFQIPFEVQNGYLNITYVSLGGAGVKTKIIPIRQVDVTMTVNGTQSMQGTFGQAINIAVLNPAANTNTSAIDTLVVRVLGANVPTVTLRETAPNSGVFSAILRIGDDANISATPESTIQFVYVHNASIDTPFGSSVWFSKTVTATVKITSTPGVIVSPPDGFRTGPVGVLNITIFDPDRNRNINSSDSISFIIRRWDGSTLTFTATETGSNTGYFTALVDKSQIGSPADLLRGGVIQIVYSDPFTPMGPMSVVATVRFSSVDAQVRLDKSFYLPGELITITIIDNDSVTNPSIIETVTVTVTSTSDPLGIQVVLEETAPGSGIFVGTVLVSNASIDRGKPRTIYANIGDTITVSYEDPFPADYAVTGRSKIFTATALVGQQLEKPVSISPTLTISFLNGTSATTIVAGQQYLISVNLTNNNPTPVSFTVLFLVLDPRGTPVQIQFQSTTLAPGQSILIGFSVTFPSAGDYTVRIIVVKSLADQTALSDRFEQVVRVVS
jgi:hypothetical protein